MRISSPAGGGYGGVGGVGGVDSNEGGPRGLERGVDGPLGPDSTSRDVELEGLTGGTPQPGGAPALPPSSGEGDEGGGVQPRDPKRAKDARDRHLHDPHAMQLQHQLQAGFGQPGEDDRGVGRAEGSKKADQKDQKDRADDLRSAIQELRGEARALRAGAVEMLEGAPTGEDALDSRRFNTMAAANDAEADGLEPKLREEEEKKRRVVEVIEPQGMRAPTPAAAAAG